MRNISELQTLPSNHLTAVHGGNDKPWGDDVASRFSKATHKTVHSWRMRTGQAFTDLATRNVPGAVGNSFAATADVATAPAKIAGTVLGVVK
jgi:hypothetical protein